MSGDGATIRRRRVCSACKKRFTTYERVEEAAPMVVKKDGRREPFERAKIIAGIKRACEKRPVSMETIEQIADRVEASALERGEREVASTFIGSALMSDIQTEVFLLPASSSVEKEGSLSNSGRWAQWRYKAIDPIGQSKPDSEIMNELYFRVKSLYQKQGGKFPAPYREPHLELR